VFSKQNNLCPSLLLKDMVTVTYILVISSLANPNCLQHSYIH